MFLRRTRVVLAVAAGLTVLWVGAQKIEWGDVLVPPLEARFARVDAARVGEAAGLVVLIGQEERLREAGRLARAHPQLELLISGGSPVTRDQIVGLLGPGIDPAKIIYEDLSQNTYENAQQTALILAKKPAGRWLLVTSASHMPRAIGVFRRLGTTLDPWPVYDLAQHNPKPEHRARHEWLGLIGYWAMGKTSALFPGP